MSSCQLMFLGVRSSLESGFGHKPPAHLSVSLTVILLLVPSIVFLISVIVLLISVCVFFISSMSLMIVLTVLNASCIFSILFSSLQSIFTIIILNSLLGRVFISSSFIWFFEFLPCSFICAVFLSFHLFLSNFLHLKSPFPRL